jgi:REP element-mobilizing transposase RayT
MPWHVSTGKKITILIKFKNKYRIPSIRLKDFDYSSNNAYFVTICTRNKHKYFGSIIKEENKIKLTAIGKKASEFWQEIPEHFDNALLDEFIIMPNHVHGIIIINNTLKSVETCHGMSQNENKSPRNAFSKPVKKSLSMIINHYKGSVKRYCNKNKINFEWQSRFYERIIRNENEIDKIREYIYYNPIKWEFDKNIIENLKIIDL